ncbi:MAG: hypothetical protein JSU66_12895 [Deltaproteobacteria bacterium]|nr:MAG: hypothetical protein JSU66_12895 [Deltaproteobacteria bacterium]
MGWLLVLLFWIAFAGTHMALSSSSVRPRLVAGLSERGYQGLYSLVAFATFVPLVWIYWRHKHEGPLLWNFADVPGVREVSIGLTALGFVFVALSFFQPSATAQTFLEHAKIRARGVNRITRHPLFAGIAIWGLAHVIVNGFLSDVLFFGGFAFYSVIGAAHQDSRKRSLAGDPLAAYYGETSLVPFGAIAAGRNRLVLAEISWPAVAIGIALATALFWFHGALFG